MHSPVFDGLSADLFMPMDPAPAAIVVRSRHRTRVTQAESGRIISGRYGGQYYEVSLSYNPMTREQAAPLVAFLQGQNGRYGVFHVEICGLAHLDGLHAANFANFENDTKLHMVQDAVSESVIPPARSGGSTLYTDQVFMRASLSSDVQTVELGRTGLIRLSVDLIERL